MALTPLLNELGRKTADFIGEKLDDEDKTAALVNFDATEPVIILGFGQMGQVLANFLSMPLVPGVDGDVTGWSYVVFDLDPSVVKASRALGFPVLYGDGSRPAVLQSAGISLPKAFMVMHTGRTGTVEAFKRIRLAFPATPIYARARDLAHLLDLKKTGATYAILENAEISLQLGSKLLKGLGVMSDDVTFLSQLLQESMELQAQEVLGKTEDQEFEVVKPLQVRVADSVGPRIAAPSVSAEHESLRLGSTETYHILVAEELVDQLKHDEELLITEDVDGRGVSYCELDTTNSSPISNEDTMEEKIKVDPSMPCVTTKEGL